jgi:hypothetical protein
LSLYTRKAIVGRRRNAVLPMNINTAAVMNECVVI